MLHFNYTITFHSVSIDVAGTYCPSEPPTRDYPGSPAEVRVTRYEINSVDISTLIDAADWHEAIEIQLLAVLGEPAYA